MNDNKPNCQGGAEKKAIKAEEKPKNKGKADDAGRKSLSQDTSCSEGKIHLGNSRKRRACGRRSHGPSKKRRKDDRGDESDTKFEIGENFYTPKRQRTRTGLRPIFIDGSNVAYSHGNNRHFSVKGLKMCIDFFRKRGHEVKAFVPQFRLKKNQTDNPALLRKLVDKKHVIVTPSLMIRNRIRSPYDDWYIVQAAAIEEGVIVSADNFRDIVKRRPSLRPVVEESRLVPTWVRDTLLFPMDPLGSRRCDLDAFLRF